MRAVDFVGKPHVYVDMDGVQADFFTAWAQLHGKDRYKEIGDRTAREQSINDLNARGPEFVQEFFARLPVLNGGIKMLKWLNDNGVPYTILSSPLRGNEEASIVGKKIWLQQHNPASVNTAIFADNKERWARKGSQPNILIDDFKQNITKWNSAGGIGILFRDANYSTVVKQLAEIFGIDQTVAEHWNHI